MGLDYSYIITKPQSRNLTICIEMFDKVKLCNFEKVKKVVVLNDL